MARLNRFLSSLDRFEDRLELSREEIKRKLCQLVDDHFNSVANKVGQTKAQLEALRSATSRALSVQEYCSDDNPIVVPLSFDANGEEFDSMGHHDGANFASTSKSGQKRQHPQRTIAKRQKVTQSEGQEKNFVCKHKDCGKSFINDGLLANHERIHLGLKPFSCTWRDCHYRAEQPGSVYNHIRGVHFKLPQSKKKQDRLNIVDNREAKDYVQVDTDLLARRLQ